MSSSSVIATWNAMVDCEIELRDSVFDAQAAVARVREAAERLRFARAAYSGVALERQEHDQ